MVDVPVVLVAQVSQVRVVEETAGISQLPLVEKIAGITDIRTGQGTQTSESLNTAFLRQVTQAEIGALPTSECGRSANLKRITQQPDSDQQQQQDNQPQAARQSARQEREKKREEGRKKKGDMLNKLGVRRKEGKPRKKSTGRLRKKDVTGWTVVTRNKRQRKMIQIFVKVQGDLDGGESDRLQSR